MCFDAAEHRQTRTLAAAGDLLADAPLASRAAFIFAAMIRVLSLLSAMHRDGNDYLPFAPALPALPAFARIFSPMYRTPLPL